MSRLASPANRRWQFCSWPFLHFVFDEAEDKNSGRSERTVHRENVYRPAFCWMPGFCSWVCARLEDYCTVGVLRQPKLLMIPWVPDGPLYRRKVLYVSPIIEVIWLPVQYDCALGKSVQYCALGKSALCCTVKNVYEATTQKGYRRAFCQWLLIDRPALCIWLKLTDPYLMQFQSRNIITEPKTSGETAPTVREKREQFGRGPSYSDHETSCVHIPHIWIPVRTTVALTRFACSTVRSPLQYRTDRRGSQRFGLGTFHNSTSHPIAFMSRTEAAILHSAHRRLGWVDHAVHKMMPIDRLRDSLTKNRTKLRTHCCKLPIRLHKNRQYQIDLLPNLNVRAASRRSRVYRWSTVSYYCTTLHYTALDSALRREARPWQARYP